LRSRAGLAILEAANGLVAFVAGALAWRFVRRLAGPTEATACALLFATVFLTGPLTAIGSFSWLIPYSHELTHGVLLLLSAPRRARAMACPSRESRARRVRLAGGSMPSDEAEITIAAGAMLVTACALAEGRRSWRPMAIAGAAARRGPLAAWACLSSAMPGPSRWTVSLAAGPPDRSAPDDHALLPLFLGSDRPSRTSARCWRGPRHGRDRDGRGCRRANRRTRGRAARAIGWVAAVGIAAAWIAGRDLIPWYDVFPAAAGGRRGDSRVGRGRHTPRGGRVREARGALTATAARERWRCTLKMILFARIWHYGFASDAAALLAVASIGAAVRRATRARGGSSWLLAACSQVRSPGRSQATSPHGADRDGSAMCALEPGGTPFCPMRAAS
jgi:hypothetical protein